MTQRCLCIALTCLSFSIALPAGAQQRDIVRMYRSRAGRWEKSAARLEKAGALEKAAAHKRRARKIYTLASSIEAGHESSEAYKTAKELKGEGTLKAAINTRRLAREQALKSRALLGIAKSGKNPKTERDEARHLSHNYESLVRLKAVPIILPHSKIMARIKENRAATKKPEVGKKQLRRLEQEGQELRMLSDILYLAYRGDRGLARKKADELIQMRARADHRSSFVGASLYILGRALHGRTSTVIP